MTNQIKYYSLNNLPSSAEIGAIYFLSNGSQYIGTSANTFLPISDFIFTETLDIIGIMDKVYVHKEADKTSLKIWNGTSFELLSGESYDDTTIQQAITVLQNKVTELENNEVDLTPLQDDITELEGKVTTLQDEIVLKGNVKSVNGNVPDANGNVSITIDSVTPYDDTELRGKITTNEGKISTLETKVADLESIPTIDLSPLETQIDEIENELVNIDGKVKLNNSDTSAYLDSKLDNETIQIIANKLVTMKLNGQLSTIEELNFLVGATSNIQTQINNLSSIVAVKDEIVDTENDLPTEVDEIGTIILVRSDSTQDGNSTFYRSNGTVWEYINKINSDVARDFTTQPLDLITESTGILPKSRYEKSNASDISVTDTANNFTSTDVEGILEELNTKIDNLPAPQQITLNDTVTSTSTTEAGTANAVKTAYDKGVEALNLATTANNKIVTKADIGLDNVENVRQMPISGGVLESYSEKLTTLSSGVIDLSLGNVFTHTLSANTTYSITNAVANTAHSFTLFITQGATARTITFPASVKWQSIPDLSVISKTYILSFVTTNGGATWYGVLGGMY